MQSDAVILNAVKIYDCFRHISQTEKNYWLTTILKHCQISANECFCQADVLEADFYFHIALNFYFNMRTSASECMTLSRSVFTV